MRLLDVNKDWRQARPKLIKDGDQWIFTGYQSYKYIKDKMLKPIGKDLMIKDSIIGPYLLERLRSGDTVLDLGCANMYFGLMAREFGVAEVTGIDLDLRYLRYLSVLVTEENLDNVKLINMNATDVTYKYDVVFALAIMHWIYSCTGFMGSVEKIVKYLSGITKRMLFVEWIGPDDKAIQMFKHIKYNKDKTKDDYNKMAFVDALQKSFSTVNHIGSADVHREMFLCLK